MVKAPKDPNAPKRPLSAYMLWAADTRDTVAAKHPNYSITEVATELGKMWKSVSDDEKAQYISQNTTLREVYAAKMTKYKESSSYKKHQEVVAEFKRKQDRKHYKKDPNAPKRPPSAYMIYVSEVREEVMKEKPGIEVNDVLKEIGTRWRSLDTSEESYYQKKAEKLKVKYDKELKAYQKTEGYKAHQAEKEAFLAKRKERRQREKSASQGRKARKPSKPRKRSRKRKAMKRRVPARRRKASGLRSSMGVSSRSRSRSKQRRKAKKSKSPSRSGSRKSSMSRSSSRSKSSKSRSVSKSRSRKAKAPKSPVRKPNIRRKSVSKPRRRSRRRRGSQRKASRGASKKRRARKRR